MSQKTSLYDTHVQAGALMVDFAGWEMPLHYGSQVQEHHYVRQTAGIFDVSHMGIVDIEGTNATAFLRYLLANDVAKLKKSGEALYTCMLNEKGGVIDDLIVYRLDNYYRLVINAGCRDKDIQWITDQGRKFQVSVKPRTELSMIAVQGPLAIAAAVKIFSGQASNLQNLNSFNAFFYDDFLIARTGYTGEDGFEIILPATKVAKIWQQFVAQGVHPCGLGARDTLRLEAGLNLYGSDMDEETSPLVSNLSWTVSWQDENREFIGKDALLKEKSHGVQKQLAGLILEQGGVLRHGQRVLVENNGEGVITSGSFAPSLNYSIALARIPILQENARLQIERRGHLLPVKVVKPPFIKKRIKA